MMRKIVAVSLICFFAGWSFSEEKPTEKFAIILQAGNETNEGMSRAAHALMYATELLENGYDVVLIFDGAGTGWANELRKPENPLHKKYLKIQELGMVEEICDECAEKFKVKDQFSPRQRSLLAGEYEGHPSLVKWVTKGYQIIVL